MNHPLQNPLIVLVHVPKTAGSTVSRAMSEHFSRGYDHCEALLGPGFSNVAEHAEWVSGHIDFTTFSRALSNVTNRPLRFFATIREPTRQLMSHYNWLIEIFNRGSRFYNAHPEHIKAISARVRAADNTDPEEIVEILKENEGLFLNTQSRIILGPDFNWNGGKVMRRLQNYEFIGTERDIPQLLSVITETTERKVLRRNVSPYHFDREVFQHPRIRNFCIRRNFLDWALYSAINESQFRGAVSPSFRRANRVAPATVTVH